MLHFSKQFLIVKLVTSFQASCIHQIAAITSTPLKIFVADASSWMLASTFLTILFQYLILKFWMMPASSGCSLKVVFFGKKLTLIYKNWSIIDCGWHVELPRKIMTFLPSNTSFLLKSTSTASITPDVIQDLGFEKWWTLDERDGSCNFLKQCGSLLFQMTMGWLIFSLSSCINKKGNS